MLVLLMDYQITSLGQFKRIEKVRWPETNATAGGGRNLDFLVEADVMLDVKKNQEGDWLISF